MDDTPNKQRNGNRRGRRPQHKPNPANAYTPPYAADVLSTSIEGIGLSEQTVAVLVSGKITTVGDIARRRKGDMFRVQNFGKKQLTDVCKAIAALGVDFRPDDKPQGGAPMPNENARSVNGDRQRPNGDKPQDKGKDKNKPAAGKKDVQSAKQQNAENKRQSGANQGQENKNSDKNNKGKNKFNKQFDENLTLDKLFPKPKMVRLPRIEQETDAFVKFQRGGKWGFKNRDGVEVIPPIYDEVFNFKEDYACVERKQLFGYINRQNELIIPYKYVCASSFSEGYACVSDEEKCGYIDKEGNVVVPFKYEAGTAVKDGLAHVKLDGKWGTLTIATNTISWA